MPSILEQLQDPATRLLFERVVKGEAGDSPDDMRDVIGSIFNRARMGNQSLRDVLLSKGQFTSVSDFPGNARDKLGGLGADALSTQSSALDQALQQFDPQTGTLKGFNPNVVDFYQPAAQAQYHAKYPGTYQEQPAFARGKKPTYTGSSGQQYYEGTYKGGLPTVSDLSSPPSATGAQNPDDLSQFQLPPEQAAMVKENQAAAHALLPEELANIDAQGPMIDEEIKGLEAWQASANSAYARYDKTMSNVMANLPDEHKMEMENLKEVSPDHPGDPHRALTQFLPMLVMLGGMFARGGGIGAMKASAAAVNAARSHDDEALKRAHQDFQDNLTEAVDKASMAHEQLGEAIAESGGNQKLLLQKAELLAAKLDMPHLKIAALNGDTNAILTAFANQSKALGQAASWQRAQSYVALNQAKIAQIGKTLAGGGQLTQSDLGYAAETYRLTRQLPPLGYGQSAVESRQKIIDEANRLARGEETDEDVLASAQAARGDVGGQFDVKAVAGSINRLQNLKANIAQNEGTASAVADQILQLAPKAALGGPPVINRWLQGGRKAILGDGDVTAFNDTIATFTGEYAAVMTGSANTGGRGTTDQARREAQALIDNSYTPEMLEKTIAQMKKNMEIRLQTIDGVIQSQQGLMPGADQPAQQDPGYIPNVDKPPPKGGGGGGGDAGGPEKLTQDNVQDFRQDIIKGRDMVTKGATINGKLVKWTVAQFEQKLREGWDVNDKQVADAVQGLQ